MYNNRFLKAMEQHNNKTHNMCTNYNKTLTENNAITNISSLSTIVDWFYHGAALRNERDTSRILNLFFDAFKTDPTQALRILFYIRDIRGGQGERRIFRIILKQLAFQEVRWLKKNLHLIPKYGRWDDLFELINTPIEGKLFYFIKNTLTEDMYNAEGNKSISLLAKWMPSENTSSHITKHLAKRMIQGLELPPREYRKVLSKLRNYINIEYDKIPSKASMKYRKAFKRHDAERYEYYLEQVRSGKKKINTSTLYPYELLEKCLYGGHNDTLDLMWNNLPDYVPEINGLVVADTSGSMRGTPMAVSVSLAMYIAERNKNKVWKNQFISFSAIPKFHTIKGKTLYNKAMSVILGDVANTNIQAVFNLILETALNNDVLKEDMPKVLIIVSDMEFDECSTGNRTNFQEIERMYNRCGYERPTLIFWNVESRNTQTPVTINDRGVVLLSGASPRVFEYALGKVTNPIDLVYNITNSDRYKNINY